MRDTAEEARTNSETTFSYRLLHMELPVLVSQQRLACISSIRTQDATLKTDQERWMVGINGKRGSENSMLLGQLDDDDDNYESIKEKGRKRVKKIHQVKKNKYLNNSFASKLISKRSTVGLNSEIPSSRQVAIPRFLLMGVERIVGYISFQKVYTKYTQLPSGFQLR